MNHPLGIGIDLTQHIPVVGVCRCPAAISQENAITSEQLAKNWPPVTEVWGKFASQIPVALLPMIQGEPILAGDAAAYHRRSAGFAWPPESQIPYDDDAKLGQARIPLVAAWMSILPRGKSDSSMTHRHDHEFSWMPDGDRPLSARAGDILARSIKTFLDSAKMPFLDCLTAVVVPDSLDEAGQQILLDALGHCGFDLEKIHLLPRPLATALYWCQNGDVSRFGDFGTTTGEEGKEAGRLRLLTMSLDYWEAQSFEIRARFEFGRSWLVPIRDRFRISEQPPELPFPGIAVAINIAQGDSETNDQVWWHRLFSSNWISQRLKDGQPLSQEEYLAFISVQSKGPSPPCRRKMENLKNLTEFWQRCFGKSGHETPSAESIWAKQEKLLGISYYNNFATLATGAFAHLRGPDNRMLAQTIAGETATMEFADYDVPVRGAALAAAAIAYKLPCYRETLLPLELYVSKRDDLGDLRTDWVELVPKEKSVEAGKPWKSPSPIAVLQIKQGNRELWLPLKRLVHQSEQFREVASGLMEPTKADEPVRVDVAVKPGQGYARVNITSLKPGVFSTRLDWRTMKECEKPEPPPLTYLPGVSKIEPYKPLFWDAAPLMRAILSDFENGNRSAMVRLRELIGLLNKWPLASNVDRKNGRIVTDDFMKHYGVLGSEGLIQDLKEPELVRTFQSALGAAFARQLSKRRNPYWNCDIILRAAGWMYLAMPDQCYTFLRQRVTEASRKSERLSAVELNAIGLAFVSPNDLQEFYPLAVDALSRRWPPNNWLRAIRNICRFRNHALHPDVISGRTLSDLVELLYQMLKSEFDDDHLANKFSNCLESFPFLLKRRRYDSDFLSPDSRPAKHLISLLEKIDAKRCRLSRRIQNAPKATLNFLCKRATISDIENLLGMDDPDTAEGND